MMRFIKRERRESASQAGECASSASASCPFASSISFFGANPFSKKTKNNNHIQRSDTAATGSTGDESSFAEVNDKGWLVENVLDGPVREEDWWSDPEPQVETTDHNKKQQRPEARQFRNKGLETWEKTRSAWTRRNPHQEVAKAKANAAPKTTKRFLSKLRHRELQRNLLVERQFVLPKPMPLGELVGVYNEIWDTGHSRDGD